MTTFIVMVPDPDGFLHRAEITVSGEVLDQLSYGLVLDLSITLRDPNE